MNGSDCGIAWTAPWRVEVTDALRTGDNLVEIEVTNPWMNRLIAEAAAPTGELFEPVTTVYAPDAPIRSAGLSGPVVLELHTTGPPDDHAGAMTSNVDS